MHNGRAHMTTIRGFYGAARPLVFAHRGGRALGPENTIAAFDAGMAAGADGLELDVHLSSDGVPVVVHDALLDRTTDQRGPVRARTAAELAAVDAAWAFAPEQGHPLRGCGIGVPTLESVLRRHPDTRVIIELKMAESALAQAVAGVVRRTGAVERVCLGGFHDASVRAARRALPGIASSAGALEVRLALYRSWVGFPVRRPAYGGYQVPEVAGRTRVVSPRFLRHAHAAGLQVQVWTVNELDDMQRLLGWGVDALITDRPDLAVQVARADAGKSSR